MVLCTDCKHFVITTLIEGDYCDAIDEILDDDLVYRNIPCDFFESDINDDLDGNDSS